MTARRFDLYPEEQHWWSFSDYGTVLDTVRAIGAKKVLEFGPGSSTLALLEGGVERVDACEDEDEWLTVWQDRLSRFSARIRWVAYQFDRPLRIPQVRGRYDLALIDGPKQTERRPQVLEFALGCCTWVLMPTEECADKPGGPSRPWMRPLIKEAAARRGCLVEFISTGPTAGAFALVGPT